MYAKKNKKVLGQSGDGFRGIQTPRRQAEASAQENTVSQVRSRRLSRRASNMNMAEGPAKAITIPPEEVKIALTPLRPPESHSLKAGAISNLLMPGLGSSQIQTNPSDIVRVALKDIDKHQSPSLYGEMFNQFEDGQGSKDNPEGPRRVSAITRKSNNESQHTSTFNLQNIPGIQHAQSITLPNASSKVLNSQKLRSTGIHPSQSTGGLLQVKDLKIPEREPDVPNAFASEPIVLLKTDRLRMKGNGPPYRDPDGPLAMLTSRSNVGLAQKGLKAELSTQPSTYRGQTSNSVSANPQYSSQHVVRLPPIKGSLAQSSKHI